MFSSGGVNMFFFFFSSRRRHTRFDCDWSSDVCSSDLPRRRSRSRAATTRGCARHPARSARGRRRGCRSTRRRPRSESATRRSARRCPRSEEHTSELQSQSNLVCRLLLEKKKNTQRGHTEHYLLGFLYPLCDNQHRLKESDHLNLISYTTTSAQVIVYALIVTHALLRYEV